MLSYRHHFHAGNHADILKHFCYWYVINYLLKKDKPITVIDTHAGIGLYSLLAPAAQKNTEYHSGITRLKAAKTLPPLLAEFCTFLTTCLPAWINTPHYTGSAWLAASLLRDIDRLHLYERHPQDIQILRNTMQNAPFYRRIRIQSTDGFQGLISELPPPSRRAVILIDPPYEDKKDYQRTFNTLHKAMRRFATGCYLLWYPVLQTEFSYALPIELKEDFPENHLHVRLDIRAPSKDGFGMHGSGMFILNPPYTMAQELSAIMPHLTKLLAQDRQADFLLESAQS